jgi:outer membrane lipopolysaccharide assembly protein LptE/RlpB
MLKVLMSLFLILLLCSCMFNKQNKKIQSHNHRAEIESRRDALRNATNILPKSNEENCIFENSKTHMCPAQIIRTCNIEEEMIKMAINMYYRCTS